MPGAVGQGETCLVRTAPVAKRCPISDAPRLQGGRSFLCGLRSGTRRRGESEGGRREDAEGGRLAEVFVRMRRVFKEAALASASASSNGEVTRRFAFTPASKAGLCPWPLVTGTACVAAFQGNDFQSLGKPAGFPLSRAFARVRKKGSVRCRSLGTRRALALLRVPSHHLAFDHQMTPPSHGPLIALRAPEALSFGSAVGHRFAGPPT